MKIKFNNVSLAETLQILNKFNQVSGKLGYAISKTKKIITRQLEPFEEERQKLFQKYGEKDEQTGNLRIDQNSENFTKFMEQFKPLAQDIQIELDIFQITREEFEGNESLFEVKDATVNDFDLLQELFIKKTQDKTE